MNNIQHNLLYENVKKWLAFLSIFLSPPTFETNSYKPLIKLNLEINLNKRKKSIISDKDVQKTLLSIEPSFSVILKTLITPLEMLIESIYSLCKLDKHLFPLLGLKYKPAYYINKENPSILEGITWIKDKLQSHLRYLKKKFIN